MITTNQTNPHMRWARWAVNLVVEFLIIPLLIALSATSAVLFAFSFLLFLCRADDVGPMLPIGFALSCAVCFKIWQFLDHKFKIQL